MTTVVATKTGSHRGSRRAVCTGAADTPTQSARQGEGTRASERGKERDDKGDSESLWACTRAVAATASPADSLANGEGALSLLFRLMCRQL